MNSLRSEIAVAYRTLSRHSVFALTAILSLAVAIGLNTTTYSVLDALLAPRVAMRYPGRVMHVHVFGDTRHRIDTRTLNSVLKSASDVFDGYTGQSVLDRDALLESDHAFLNGYAVTVLPNFFNVVGSWTRYGRVFDSSEVTAPSLPIILSERAARRLFPKISNPVGQPLHLDGTPYVVVGVIAREAWLPRDETLAWVLPPQNANLAEMPINVVRMRSGITAAQLDNANNKMVQLFASAGGVSTRDVRVWLSGFVGGQAHLAMLHYALVAAVFAVLLVACANIANLQIARGIARSRELATRAALGASRRDLVMHLVTESALIGAAGLVLGLVLTCWGMHVIRAVLPDNIGEYIVEPQTSWRLFAFAALATAVCVFLIGLLPALRVSRVDVNELLKRGAGTGSMRSARRQYGLLVSAEIGFALPVLCGAALLVRAAMQSDDAAKVWDQSMLSTASIRVDLPRDSTWSFESAAAEIASRLRAQPGIADVVVTQSTPDADAEISGTISGGAPHVVPAPMWSYNLVTPSALRTYGFSLIHGRDFREGERGAVAITSPSLATRIWPGGSAIGQMIKFGSPDKPGRWYTVIGIRQPITTGGDASDAYVLADSTDRLTGADRAWRKPFVRVVARAAANPQRLSVTLRRALQTDRRFTVLAAHALDEQEEIKRANTNFISALFSVFAILALCLAAIGVYGIVSHAVAERRRELGVRIALGATPANILHAVLREANVYALAGVAVGLYLITRGAPLVAGFLAFPEIDMYSIELYIPAAVLLFATALIAALVPAHRATRIDPVEAMRCE